MKNINVEELKTMEMKLRVFLREQFISYEDYFNETYDRFHCVTTPNINVFLHLNGYNQLSIRNRKKGKNYYVDLNNFTITANRILDKTDLHFIYNTFYNILENMLLKNCNEYNYSKINKRLHNNMIHKYYAGIFSKFKRAELNRF